MLIALIAGAPIAAETPVEHVPAATSDARDLWKLARESADVVRFSTLFTAQNARDHLSTADGSRRAVRWCRDTGVTRVYLEVFRDGYTADREVLSRAADQFRREGFLVSGCITTTGLGRRSVRGWSFPCFTDPPTLETLTRTVELAAALFDEIMIDDFFATNCECDSCVAAKGERSWSEFRCDLLVDVSRRYVLEPARRANPKVRLIIKYPQWYDEFQRRGYDVARETAMFDRIWVGTETRDPDNRRWGRKSQYEAYFIMRWLGGIGGEKCGGGWFDPYGTTPLTYVEQARQTILADAREVLLFCYGSLQDDTGPANVEALRKELPLLVELARMVRGKDIRGVVAPKPPGSEAHGDEYVYDFVGLLGLPLVPSPRVRLDARAVFLPAQSVAEAELETKLETLLEAKTPLLVTRHFAERLPQRLRSLPEHVSVLDVPGDRWALMELEPETLRRFRSSLLAPFGIELEAPTRVALYLFGNDVVVVENFNDRGVDVTLRKDTAARPELLLAIPRSDVFPSTGEGSARLTLPARSLAALRFSERGS